MIRRGQPRAPRDLVDIFDGADPGEDSPGTRSLQCETCGTWNTVEDGLDQGDLRCEVCGDSLAGASDSWFR